eukprot:762521-Hanusia_phi.AAC.34
MSSVDIHQCSDLARPHSYKTQKKNALHEDSVWALSWPQDDRLISGSIDETVKVWKMASESGEKAQAIEVQPISTFPGHFLGVVSVAASKYTEKAQCDLIILSIRGWLTGTGNSVLLARWMEGYEYGISVLTSMLFCFPSHTSDSEERAVQRSIDPGLVETWTVCFHPSGAMLASGTQTGKINVYHTQSKEDKPEATIKSDGRFILATAYSPCGSSGLGSFSTAAESSCRGAYRSGEEGRRIGRDEKRASARRIGEGRMEQKRQMKEAGKRREGACSRSLHYRLNCPLRPLGVGC